MKIDLPNLVRSGGTRRKRVTLRPIEPSRKAESEYRKVLRWMVGEMRRHVEEQVIPTVERERDQLMRDAAGDDTGNSLEEFNRIVEQLQAAAAGMANRIFEAEKQRHTKRFAQSVREAIGIDMEQVLASNPALDEQIRLQALRNAGIIKGLGDDTQKRVAETITRNLQRGGSKTSLREELSKAFGFEESRAKLIARNEVGNINSQLNAFRQQEIGVKEYEWRTSQDEHVRDLHRGLHGKTFRWDKPGPAEGGAHPGEAINCRCVGRPVISLEEFGEQQAESVTEQVERQVSEKFNSFPQAALEPQSERQSENVVRATEQLRRRDITFAELREMMPEVERLRKRELAEVAEMVTGVRPSSSLTRSEMARQIEKRVGFTIEANRRRGDTARVFGSAEEETSSGINRPLNSQSLRTSQSPLPPREARTTRSRKPATPNIMPELEQMSKADLIKRAEEITGVRPSSSNTKAQIARDIRRRIQLERNVERRRDDTSSIF